MLSVHSRSSCLYSKYLFFFLQAFSTQATSLTQILLQAEGASIRTNHRHTPATKTLSHLHSWSQCPRRRVFHRGPLISSHWKIEIQNVSHTCWGEEHETKKGTGLTSPGSAFLLCSFKYKLPAWDPSRPELLPPVCRIYYVKRTQLGWVRGTY